MSQTAQASPRFFPTSPAAYQFILPHNPQSLLCLHHLGGDQALYVHILRRHPLIPCTLSIKSLHGKVHRLERCVYRHNALHGAAFVSPSQIIPVRLLAILFTAPAIISTVPSRYSPQAIRTCRDSAPAERRQFPEYSLMHTNQITERRNLQQLLIQHPFTFAATA